MSPATSYPKKLKVVEVKGMKNNKATSISSCCNPMEKRLIITR